MRDLQPGSERDLGGAHADASPANGRAARRALDLGLGDGVEVVAELGRGARTVVYRIRRGGVDYAVKLLQRALVIEERDAAAFCREAALLARVNHPGVPAVYDVGTTLGRPYLVQEYVDGVPLGRLLAAGPLEEPALLRLATDVAAALEAAHRAGVVHRDIKPANILMSATGRARLIDFGLAAAGDAPDRRGVADRTAPSVIGTFQYSSPEQSGMLSRAVDGRADLYSLGAVLFQCATGALPYEARDVGDLLAMHASSPVPDPRVRRPDLSQGWAAVITRLLAKDPEDRYAGAGDLLAALDRLDPRPAGTPAAAGGARPGPPGRARRRRLPMAGREHERSLLVRRWEQARAGRGGVALVVGAPGAGKSHLARAIAEDVRADGGLVLAGKCDRDASLPLAPLRTAVEGYLRTVTALPPEERAEAVRALREAAGAGVGLLRPLSPALAVLLDAPHVPGGEHHEQFVNAVAVLLTELVSRTGGVLVVDDVQWLDAASRAVLRRVVQGVAEAPLLVVATGRDDPASADALRTFESDVADVLDPRVPLGVLDAPGTGELVSWYLAGATVGHDVIAEVTARGHGNAFTILEYLRALIDAGALRPSWGTWRLDADVLRALALPHGVMDLILARIDGLGARSRTVLTTAAAIGATIEPGLLAQVCGSEVTSALADAAAHGLLRDEADGYAFIHDRIREALLSTVGPRELRSLHQLVAECLDARTGPAGAPSAVYATARHYAQGDVRRDPQRVVATGWAAGQLALDESAPDAAVSFLEPAAAVARDSGIELDSRFREALGVAYWLTGHIARAMAELEAGLAGEADPVRRAALRLQLTHVLRTSWRLRDAIDCARIGMAELGRPVPANRWVFGLATARTMARWLVAGSPPPSARPLQGRRAEELRLFVLLCRAASAAAAVNLQHGTLVAFNIRPVPVAHRLGATTAYVHHLAGVGSIAGSMGLRRRRDAIFERAFRICAELGDPKAYANTVWYDAFAKVMGRELDIARWNDASDAQRDWLELDFYTNIVLMRARGLVQRGYAVEALAWHDRGRARISEATVDVFPGFAVLARMADALLGRPVGEATAAFAAQAAAPLDTGHAIQFVLGAVQTALETEEFGEPYEQAVRAFEGLDLSVSAIFPEYRMIYVYEAYARLTLLQRATGPERAARLEAARRAVRRLGAAASGSGPSAEPSSMNLLKGYHQVARASLLQLEGQPERALDVLARAAGRLWRVDAPLVDYEAARVRARALAALGEDAPSIRAAHTALSLAHRAGWARRERWVRVEFAAATEAPHSTLGGRRHTSDPTGGDRYQRRLQALQQVSTAAARVLDPQELARVALDETLRILGAERAVLFLADDDGTLRPSLGRDVSARDLVELGGYSSTLVDRVAEERSPLVVTGSEEGAALGSQSAVVYGLRSIMVAPLELDERLLGVVYLDSRVATGVFTEADIEILTAVTSHIAVSLETARAAQLEIAVRTAREQRDAAELLRSSMQELTATLDPADLLDHLAGIVARVIPADRVCLVHRDGTVTTVAATGCCADGVPALHGAGGDPGDPDDPGDSRAAPAAPGDGAVDVDALLAVDEIRLGDAADGVPAAVRAVLGEVRSWLVAPLVTRGHGRGALLAGSASGGFTRAHADIASALTTEGAIAYDNARLFAQVQRMAVTDALTGVHNRRHFTELAQRQLAVSARAQRPLAAMMVDIDHFKRVNDTFGHSVGDDVIQAVAAAMQGEIREGDLLGRYGGEEFVLLLGDLDAEPQDVAERLRRAVADVRVPGPDGGIGVTISVGISQLRPGDWLEHLLARADEALYLAKKAGRNQVRGV